jgi:hypothetical protein
MPAEVGSEAPRALVLSRASEQDLEDAKASLPRVEDVWKGISWRLVREPEIGDRIRVQRSGEEPLEVRLVRSSSDFPNLPALIVTYRYDERVVEVLAIRAFPPRGDTVL